MFGIFLWLYLAVLLKFDYFSALTRPQFNHVALFGTRIASRTLWMYYWVRSNDYQFLIVRSYFLFFIGIGGSNSGASHISTFYFRAPLVSRKHCFNVEVFLGLLLFLSTSRHFNISVHRDIVRFINCFIHDTTMIKTPDILNRWYSLKEKITPLVYYNLSKHSYKHSKFWVSTIVL